MHITGSDEHLSEFLRQVRNFEIDIDEVLIGVDIREFVAALQEVIVVDWLDLQIIIEIRNLQQLFLSLPLNDCTDQLARLTG